MRPFARLKSLVRLLEWRRTRWALANRNLPLYDPDRVPSEFCSQYGQDAFVVDLFGGKRDGVFVEIGANDGVSISNTYYLERKLGWTGVLVEPQAEKFGELTKNRTAHAVNACAAAKEGVVTFTQVLGDANMLSGVSTRYSKKHRRRVEKSAEVTGGQLRCIDVPAVRMDRVFDEAGIEQIDYLSIDTEGGELEIAESIDLDRYRVGCVGMENNDRSLAVRRRMKERGYELAAMVGCDEMFVRPELLTRVPRAA